MLEIDGSYGEGGGQVLRTSLALSAITGQPVRLTNIRANRHKPGLRPQHLACVRATAKICAARVQGARLKSRDVRFAPQSPPVAGTYTFDVAQATKGGSAGSASLILQTVLLPLALAGGTSHVTVRGGTHVAWSPPFDYIKRVYLPTLARMGVQAKVTIKKWGWYPIGGGEVRATIDGLGSAMALSGLDLRQRGELLRVRGISASSNLPKHIRVRQEQAALQALRSQGVNVRVDTTNAPAKGKGTVVFLWAESTHVPAGFTSLGELGKPAELVAQDAAGELVAYLRGDAALDPYLSDQLVLPMALSGTPSQFTTQTITPHLLTNAWVISQFLPGLVQVQGDAGQPGTCRVRGA
ncbi:MAG: RNA 3'-terminal phosphate cyclase [Anaerolineae bacterium]|jgi:RNA 3'-terminal phosphate cyclase (ATP)